LIGPLCSKSTIRLFVSSTFRDLERERETLRREVFPIVRQACEERGFSFFEVDLRWGVTREEADAGQVLSICLEEIDRCRPFVLGLVGTRYGWIDPQALPTLQTNDRFSTLTPYADCSVTELELRYAILNRPPGTPAPVALLYRRPQRSGSADNGSADQTAKIAALVEALEQFGVSAHYTEEDLASFAERVRADLLAMIRPRLPERPATAGERARQDTYDLAEALGHRFVSSPAFEVLVDMVRRRSDRIAVIGPPGCGKSMLAAALVRHAGQGAFPGTNMVAALNPAGVREAVDALDSIGIQLASPKTTNLTRNGPATDQRRPDFGSTLATAGERGHVLAVIDGVDDRNLSTLQLPAWLPGPVSGATIVATLRADPSDREKFRRHGWQVIVMGTLTHTETTELSRRYFAPLGRRLDAKQLEAIAARPRLPIETAMILEELRCVTRFEDLDAAIARLADISHIDALLDLALDRVCGEHGKPIEDVLVALALAPDGLAETVLRSVAGEPGVPLPALQFELIRRAIDGLAAVNADRHALRSSLFSEHILRRLLPRGATAARNQIIRRLAANPEAPGAAEEMLRQMLILRDWQALAAALTERHVFDPMARRAGQQLRACWRRLQEADFSRGPSIYVSWVGSDPPRRVAEAAVLAQDLGDSLTAQALAEDAARRACGHDPKAFVVATLVCAGLAEARGDFDAATALLTAIDAEATAVPDARIVAAVRRARIVLVRSGPEVARHNLRAAEAALAQTTDERLHMSIRAMQGSIALNHGDHRGARAAFEELLRAGDRVGDLSMLGAAYAGLAKVQRARGKLDSAADLAEHARRISQVAGDDNVLQDSLGIAAKVAIERGELDSANRLIRLRRALTARIGDVIGEIESDADLARLYASLGDYGEAECTMAGVKERAHRFGLAALIR